jgi:hypothetical protein
MSKHGTKTNLKRSAAKRHAQERSNDRAVYITIIMVGLFILAIGFLATEHWPWWIVGMIAAILIMINLFGWKVVAGRKLAPWQRSLAKVPLRFAGFGARCGKPLDAAKGEDSARMALYLTAAISIVIILATWALVARILAA